MTISKEINKRIAPFMKSRGFIRSGQTRYYYIANSIAFCVIFETPTGLTYVTAHIMPLYIPCEFRYLSYGNRLDDIGDIKLPLLNKNSDEDTIDAWCKLLYHSIDQYIIPFFKKIETADKLLAFSDNYRFSPDSYIRCSKLDILRLRMFTFLYVGDFVNTASVITRYREALGSTSYLSDRVIQMLDEEINMVASLMQEKDLAKEFCASVEINIRKILQ
jgi:hypothetical protein